MRAEPERLKAEIAAQQERLARYEGDRKRFKELLQEAQVEGTALRESKPSERDVQEWARQWARRVYDFVRAACGDTPADVFMRSQGDRVSTDLDATREQAWMDNRLSRLHELIQAVGSRDTIPFRSSFDPHEWKDWKSPPKSLAASDAERLKESAERLEQEVKKLRQYENRFFLRLALKEAYDEGTRFQQRGFEDEEVTRWATRVYKLLEAALPRFYVDAFDRALWGSVKADSQERFGFHVDHKTALDSGVKQVESLIRIVDSRECPTLLPDFDGREWVRER